MKDFFLRICPKGKERGKITKYPRAVFNYVDLVIYSNAAFKASDEKATFGYVLVLDGGIVDAGASRETKVSSSIEAKTRMI